MAPMANPPMDGHTNEELAALDYRSDHRALIAAANDLAIVQATFNAKTAAAIMQPDRPAVHAAGLAAYAVWLAEINGDNDSDYLRL